MPRERRKAEVDDESQHERGDEQEDVKNDGQPQTKKHKRSNGKWGKRWPLINQIKPWQTKFDLDSSTDSEDDWDENGVYCRLKQDENDELTYDTWDPKDPSAGIAIPHYLPNTTILFPDDPVVRHNYRKVVFGHWKHGCLETFTEPNPRECTDCGSPMDWHKGDYLQKPFVKDATRLRVAYDYRGACKCRGCAAANRKKWAGGIPKQERLSMLRAYHKDGLRHLYRIATSILRYNLGHEEKLDVPILRRLDKVLARDRKDDTPKLVIAAALLKLGQTGGKCIGTDLATASINFLDHELVAARVEALLAIRCPYRGRKLSLTTNDASVEHLSIDRWYPSLPYFDAKQKLQVMSWGYNKMLSDFEDSARRKILDFVRQRDEELADMSIKLQSASCEQGMSDDEWRRLQQEGRELGWRPERGEQDWDGELGKDVKSAYKAQKTRNFVKGRPGRVWKSKGGTKYLDRRAWDGETDEEMLEDARDFHVTAGDVCAVTGTRTHSTLGIHMECDRIIDAGCYRRENCMIVSAPVNRFKATLLCFRTAAAFADHLKAHPKLLKIYRKQGLQAAAVAIVRIELDGGFY